MPGKADRTREFAAQETPSAEKGVQLRGNGRLQTMS